MFDWIKNLFRPKLGSYLNRLSQNVTVDSNNSSTANVAASSFFTGTSTSTLGVSGIQVVLKADQNCTVYVDQSTDGTNWDVSDSYNYNVIKDNFGNTTQAVGQYVRVRVKNLSSTTATTYFRLQTLLCPIVEAVPRSLDSHGHLKVMQIGMQDDFGNSGQYTQIGCLKTAEPIRLVGTVFGTSNDANFWTVSNSGTGSAATVNVIATLTSGTSNSGYGQITTVRSARFIFSNPNNFRSTARVTATAVANCTRRWGAFTVSGQTPQDGFYFELSPAGVLSVNTCKGGSATAVSSGSFNGDVAEYILDTNMHAYEISYLQATVSFYIDGVLIHTITPTTAPMTNTLTFPATATCINSASGTTSGTLEIWAALINRFGRERSGTNTKFITGTTSGQTLKLGAGTLHHLDISNVADTSRIILYDNTAASGTIIWDSGAMGKTTLPFSVDLSTCPFDIGLTVVISGAASNITIGYE